MRFLIAYFLDNISAKNYRSQLIYVEVIVSQTLDVLGQRCI